ncbi:uncharacterized protein (DUF342 family) [Peribacillus frigoritolerans]|uniref:hypothetical protein n=1 Tax=Peribacillus frigoritolerans TaxID=450367 RepID=UPI00209E6997|nr:hypothetical protein [Peribacillus frigoritolerans]MCP1493869.1 uncharacterized protein (DUF342 family) [Peribacillus frigoritolerans]
MKEENEAIPSIHNTDLLKALQHVSEQFKVSLPELRDTIESLIQKQTMQLSEADEKSSPVEELNTAKIKNREIIKKISKP